MQRMRFKVWTVMMIITLVVGLLPLTTVHADSGMVSIKTSTTDMGDRIDQHLPDRGDTNLNYYPQLDNVTANNTIEQRLTDQTTKMTATFSGTMKATAPVTSYYFDILDKNGQSVASNAPVVHKVNSQPEVTFSSGIGGISQSFDVKLTDLKNQTPIYAAIVFTASTEAPGIKNRFAFAKFSSKTLMPKITNALTRASTVIEGTGQPGSVIKSSVSNKITTVKSDGTFALTVEATALNQAEQVEIFESNTNGDYGSATAIVNSPIIISAKKTTVYLTQSDADKWSVFPDAVTMVPKLAELAQIEGRDANGAISEIPFQAKGTNVGNQLKALPVNHSLAVSIYAQVGDLKSDPITINVVKAGDLRFGDLSSELDFGRLTIPTREQLYPPTKSMMVSVIDSRQTGNWSLYASATPLKTATQQVLPGGLVYQDGTGAQAQSLTGASRLIAQGQAGGTDQTTNVTKNWSTTRGIFLDVLPTVLATDYSGQITWSLQATPRA